MSAIDDLEEKIKKARHLDEASVKQQQIAASEEESKQGIQAGIELVGSIFIPAVAGFWIDKWLGTSPAFLLTLFFVGVGVGFYNVYRLSQNLGSTVGYSELHRREKDAKTAPEELRVIETNNIKENEE